MCFNLKPVCRANYSQITVLLNNYKPYLSKPEEANALHVGTRIKSRINKEFFANKVCNKELVYPWKYDRLDFFNSLRVNDGLVLNTFELTSRHRGTSTYDV